MRLSFPNPSRSFDASKSRVCFWGYDRTIDTHIKNLRKKIAQKLPGQEIISTVYGVGYKFNAPLD